MLINAVILILREVLEAALIISVLLALSERLGLSKAWFAKGIVVGVIGAVLYADNLSLVSNLFDGIGQEIVNVSLYSLIFILISVLIAAFKKSHSYNLISFFMLSCVALSIVREGSEIIVYIEGFINIPDLLYSVLIGSSIGAGIGMSIGVFIYYLIINLPSRYGVGLGLLLLVFIAAGMVSQATQLLLQADLIVSQEPLWDTSMWLSEHSLWGEILFALMGYEATPTPIQVGLYITSIALTGKLAMNSLKSYQQKQG